MTQINIFLKSKIDLKTDFTKQINNSNNIMSKKSFKIKIFKPIN